MTNIEAPGRDDWDDIADWWINEIANDRIYRTDVHPLYRSLTKGWSGVSIDLGCGNGQGMALSPGTAVGVDLSQTLLVEAISVAPVARVRLPSLASFQDDVFDHAGAIYLLDLISDDEGLFRELARVVRPGGSLAIVINHPVYTAPGSAPIADLEGEVLWRWGSYRERGSSLESAGHRSVEFFHRPMDALLNAASEQGWNLDILKERPLSPEAIEGEPGFLGQDSIPRLLGVRWTLRERS